MKYYIWIGLIIILIIVLGFVLFIKYFYSSTQVTTKSVFNDVEIEDMRQIQEFNIPNSNQIFGIDDLKGCRTYNPSVITYKGKLMYVYRVCNHTMCTDIKIDNKYKFREKGVENFMVIEYNGSFYNVDVPDVTKEWRCAKSGFEDPRIIIFKDKLYLAANAYSGHNCNNEMWLMDFDMKDLFGNKGGITNIRPNNFFKLTVDFDKHQKQKNWMPFINNDKLHFVYSVNPHIILECDENTGHCKKIAHTYNNLLSTDMRGGSQVIRYKDNFLAVTHKNINYRYYTQIYMFSDKYPYEIISITDDFVFDDHKDMDIPKIQFASGLSVIDDYAYITYGEQDCHARLCKLPMNKILDNLKPINI